MLSAARKPQQTRRLCHLLGVEFLSSWRKPTTSCPKQKVQGLQWLSLCTAVLGGSGYKWLPHAEWQDAQSCPHSPGVWATQQGLALEDSAVVLFSLCCSWNWGLVQANPREVCGSCGCRPAGVHLALGWACTKFWASASCIKSRVGIELPCGFLLMPLDLMPCM